MFNKVGREQSQRRSGRARSKHGLLRDETDAGAALRLFAAYFRL